MHFRPTVSDLFTRGLRPVGRDFARGAPPRVCDFGVAYEVAVDVDYAQFGSGCAQRATSVLAVDNAALSGVPHDRVREQRGAPAGFGGFSERCLDVCEDVVEVAV